MRVRSHVCAVHTKGDGVLCSNDFFWLACRFGKAEMCVCVRERDREREREGEREGERES